jgi:hypothetical protein
MKANYQEWLTRQKYGAGTISAQLNRVGRVEEHYGDLDEQYARDRCESLITSLGYSKADERRNRPNPSKIPFEGNAYNNLASYRNAVARYCKFRDSERAESEFNGPADSPERPESTVDEGIGQRIGLERDLQFALRHGIAQLEPGLIIADDGAERSVASGFIDITARDSHVVVIELKAGTAGQRAVAQILSYMGDIATEEERENVRGILVASDFDRKAQSAARIVPNLSLRRYSVRFEFSDGGK